MNSFAQSEDSGSMNKYEESYAMVVLQSLSVLKAIKQDFLDDVPLPMNFANLSFNFKVFLNGIFNFPYNNYFQEILKTYNFYANNNNNNEALFHDPYHFLKYFLEFLNNENNKVKDYNYYKVYEEEKRQNKYNMESIFNSFKKYCENTQNSVISRTIYYAQMEQINCNNCNSYYNASLKPILEIDLDLYIQYRKNFNATLNGGTISLSECLNYYFNSANQTKCLNCNNNNACMYRLLINNSKLLIIYLKRNFSNGYKDINIDFNLNLSDYFNKTLTKFAFLNYSLKSCISSYGNENGYLVEYCIKKDQNNTVWFRFSNGYKQIQENELLSYEPILLFYEATDKKKPFFEGESRTLVLPNNNIQNMLNQNQINNNSNQTSNINNINYNQRQINNNLNAMSIINNNQINNINNMNNSWNKMNIMNNNFNQMNFINNNQMNNNMNNRLNQMSNINNMNNNFNQMNNINNNNQMNNMNFINRNANGRNMNINQMFNNPMNLMNLQMQMNQWKINNFNNNEGQNQLLNNNSNINKIQLTFEIVSEEDLNKSIGIIKMQIVKTDKVNEIIDRFFFKLQKDENTIKKFVLNGNEITRTSTKTASEVNFIDGCIIKAIKDPSFDLDSPLINNNINNNITNNINNNNNSNNNDININNIINNLHSININNDNNSNDNNNINNNNNTNNNNNNNDNNNIIINNTNNSNNNNNNNDNNNNNNININNDNNNNHNDNNNNHNDNNNNDNDSDNNNNNDIANNENIDADDFQDDDDDFEN